MNHLLIVTHTDLDGVGGVAAYLRLAGRDLSDSTVIFSEPYELHRILESLIENIDRGDKLVIIDLGPNRENYETIVHLAKRFIEKKVEMEWYDHHIWEDNGDALKSVGVKMFIDRETCATGVVVKYASKVYNNVIDSFLDELVKAVCAADLWKWDHYMAPKLFRVIGTEKGSQSDEWKLKIIEKFLNGKLWDEELQGKLESYVNKELKGYDKVLRTLYLKKYKGTTIVSVVKSRGPPANSLIGALLLSRFNADIAVIGRENGAMSLRSRNFDVQKVASFLGGGGHPRAAGAKIKVPFIIRFLSKFYPKLLSRYMVHRVIAALKQIL